MRAATMCSLFIVFLCVPAQAAATKVPIIHSTDLFHPHADPDDHYDLASLFAIPEFDIKGVILDMGGTQAKGSGRPAVEQMMKISGVRTPYAVGLSRALRSREDKALAESEEFQGGVKLILSVLRQSKEKVVLFTTGSCRDVAVAFNREPALVAEKLARLHRMGELSTVHVPTPAQEALRDLVRGREDAKEDLTRRRHRLSKFLLRQGRRYEGKRWTQAHCSRMLLISIR